MATELKGEQLQAYADEFTAGVQAGAIDSGEAPQIELLRTVQGALGDSKLLNDPVFFYWKMAVPPLTIELCGYDIDEFDNSLSLFAVDFGEPCHSFDKTIADKLGNRAANFVRMVLKGNGSVIDSLENEASDLKDEILTLENSRLGLTKVNVIIISNGVSIMRNRESKGSIKGTNIDMNQVVWDIKWIYENCQLQKEHEEIILDFKTDEYLIPLVGDGIPYLEVPQSDALFNCYQCVVPGALLSRIYRKYGSPLLEGNVRSFLTTKTAVNRQIQETIYREPQRFYIYNNGIAAVATGVETEVVDGVPLIVRINDIQIINGGQTTASLAYGEQKRGYDLSEISVPMKLTVIHSSEDGSEDGLSSLIQKISKTSNSQNKVSDADFFSNHPFHMTMKKYSNMLSVSGVAANTTYWFYERARGEYAQTMMFNASGKKFEATHPKSMYLTKTDFAKFYEILNQEPAIVSKGSTACFNAFAKFINDEYDAGRSSKFNEIFFKEVTGVAKLYRCLEPEISMKKLSWFKGSYRANVICYALSMFFHLLGAQVKDKFDLTLLWSRNVPENLKSELLRLCEQVYYVLIDPNRPIENVTQYAKNKACWDNVQKTLEDFELDMDAIRPFMKDRLEIAVERKEAALEQKTREDVDVYSYVYSNENKNLWEPLYYFVEKNRTQFESFDRKKEIALEHVCKAMKGKAIPLREECWAALDLLEEARLIGFKVDSSR